MTIKLYDLADAEGRRFSSNCWRVQFALAHKGLAYETIPTRFTDISTVGNGRHKTIPVIDDAGTEICDSWVIANYLDISGFTLRIWPGGQKRLRLHLQPVSSAVEHARHQLPAAACDHQRYL